MENQSLFSNKQLENLELLIDKYKRQWKDIKNNTNVVDKSSRVKLYWNSISFSDDTYQNLEIDSKDKNNLRYFLAFTRNLRYKTSFKDANSFANIVELLTYFLLVNTQVLSQDINFLEENNTTTTSSIYLEGTTKNESIWYLIQVVIDTFKAQFDLISNEKFEYSSYFKLINALTFNWLQIGIDIYGISLEKQLNEVFHHLLMNKYSKLVEYINNNEDAFENLETSDRSEFSTTEFLNDLVEEAIFLQIIINNHNSIDENIIKQHFRIVFYLFEGLTDYIAVFGEGLKEMLNSSNDYLTNIHKLWFLLGLFVSILELYVFPNEQSNFDIDLLLFGLEFINTILDFLNNVFLLSSYNELSNGFQNIVADMLKRAFEKVSAYNCELTYAFEQCLNIKKFKRLSNNSLNQFNENLASILKKIFDFGSTIIYSANPKPYFMNCLKMLYPSCLMLHDANFYTDRDNVFDFFNNKVNDNLINAQDLVMIINIAASMNCQFTNGGLCLKCDISDHYYQYQLKRSVHKKQQAKFLALDSLNIIYSVLKLHVNKVLENEILQEALLNLTLKYLNHCSKSDILINICDLKNINEHIDDEKINNNINLWNLIKYGFNSTLIHLKELASDIMALLVSNDSSSNNKLTKFILLFLEGPHESFSVTATMDTLAKITLTTDPATPLKNLLLLKHLDFIQEASPAIKSDLAWCNITYIAKIIDDFDTTYQLLLPVLPTIINADTLKLDKNPASIQKIAVLTGRPFNEFLSRFINYIIPSDIITYYKKDLIQKVGDYIGCSKSEILAKPSLLSKMVAHIIVQGNCFNAKRIMRVLKNTSPDFTSNLSETMNYYGTVSEIFQYYINPIDLLDIKQEMNECLAFSNQLTIVKSFYYCSLIEYEFVSNSNNTNISTIDHQFGKISNLQSFESWPVIQQKAFYKYFERAFIGIIHSFITILCEKSVTNILFDKLRAIDGITIIIIISKKGNLISCLPQIVMGLRTGLELPETRHKSLKAWFFMVVKLGVCELESIIDIPISFIQKQWKYLPEMTQELFLKFISFVLKYDKEMTDWSTLNIVKDHTIDFVEKFSKRFVNYKPKNDWVNQLQIVNNQFQQVVVKNNKYVIMRNLLILEDILIYATKQMLLKEKARDILLQDLLINLFETAFKFQNWDFNINLKATECISYITVLDPLLFNFQLRNKKKNTVDQVYDLYDFSNQCLFMKRLIKYVLIPVFWQVKIPTYQSYISYVIQEFLRECGWSVSYEAGSAEKAELIKNDLRKNFTDLERRIIEPMRSSEFIIISNFANYEPKQYPIYKKTMNYNKWLNLLTSDLIRRLNQKSHDSATFIFIKYLQLGKCSEEVVFFETILPYVVVEVILYGDTHLLSDWESEIDTVFKINLSFLNKHQIENIKNIYDNIFNVVDYVRKMISEISAKAPKTEREIILLEKLNNYVNKISFGGVFANKSLEIASYERSILYLEQAYREDEAKVSAEYKNKLTIAFSNIQDFDALDGVEQFFISVNTLDEKLENLANSTNNWILAKECYEELKSDWSNAESLSNIKSIDVLAKNQRFDEIITKVEGSLLNKNFPHLKNKNKFLEYGLESTAIVNDSSSAIKCIEETEKLFKFLPPPLLLTYSLNKIMFGSSDVDVCNDFVKLGIITISQRFISNVKTMTVLKVKDIINKLYLLGDSAICIDYNENYQNSKSDALKGRAVYGGLDFESFFKIETVSMNLEKKFIKTDDSHSYNRFFHMAQEARKNHRPDIGMKFLMKSHNLKKDYDTVGFELEYAKMLWESGEKENAINTIKECSMDIMNSSNSTDKLTKLKTLRQYTQWCDALNRKSPTEIIDQYLKLLELCDNNEEVSFELGLYYDKYYQQRQKTITKKSIEDYKINFELIISSIKFLLTALSETSSKHLVKEALPKVVILWLDTIEKINGKPKYSYVAKDIHILIKNATKECKSNIWYTVMLQLIARLLVPSFEARSLITKILSELFKTYPQYIIWHITVMCNSKNEFIKDAGNKIISGFLRRSTKQNKMLVNQSRLLNTNLSNICNEEATKSTSTIDADFNFSNREEIFPSRIAVPIQLNFGVILPDPSLVEYSLVTVEDIAATYTVFNSLKKPKKITMIGSNGKQYSILCKKEDVNQDDQYMQFAQTMKYVLNNNKDSSKRNMDITTYFIMPLAESFGIIELVPNVITIRNILSNLYDNRDLYNERVSYLRHWNKFKNNDEQLKLLFEKNLKIFKPILFEWFLSTFPDPAKWYHCRTNFSRSYGVMCMVGHILGLGDRHFDNILISEKNGVVLHVDYDCLFEKGVDLPTPELVPFRLTNNIVDCLGITGVEGTFRKSCELSMTLIRENEVMLLNEFEMLMYGRMKSLEEQKNKKEASKEARYLFIGRSGLSPEQILVVIRNKMRGIDPKDSVTVSVAAQVENLLKEAQNKNLLYRMYSGWMPIW